jgi:hypothetical protein
MNGHTAVIELRRPVFAGWGFFVLAFIPLAVFFPLLVWPLLLSVSILLSAGSARAAASIPSAWPGHLARGAHPFRAPPLA